MFEGNHVLITGGCGYIGSNISRELARLRCKKVILFDLASAWSDTQLLLEELYSIFAPYPAAPSSHLFTLSTVNITAGWRSYN